MRQLGRSNLLDRDGDERKDASLHVRTFVLEVRSRPSIQLSSLASGASGEYLASERCDAAGIYRRV